jgi:hypothetical protein
MNLKILQKAIYVFVLVLLMPAQGYAEYTDTVVLKNGNEISGNVKSMAQGKLLFDTDAMGTVTIKLDKVAEILSTTTMEIETVDGDQYFGKLEKPQMSQQVTISSDSTTTSIPIDDMVHIIPIGESFWKRLQGSMSAGFSYTKSSDVAQFSFSGNVLYQARRNQVGFTYTNIVTNQDSGSSQQLYGRLGYRYTPGKHWYGLGFISFQRNQELGVDGRGVLGAGAGRTLFESSRGVLSVNGGIDLNLENDGATQNSSVEAFTAIEYALYKYAGIQSNLVISAIAFPSLTESGRFRWQIDTSWHQQLYGNLYWDWTFYASGDNDPPESASSNSDYGVITSLGWTFGR